MNQYHHPTQKVKIKGYGEINSPKEYHNLRINQTQVNFNYEENKNGSDLNKKAVPKEAVIDESLFTQNYHNIVNWLYTNTK